MSNQLRISKGFRLNDPHLLLLKEKMVELLKASVHQRIHNKKAKRSYAKDKPDFASCILKYSKNKEVNSNFRFLRNNKPTLSRTESLSTLKMTSSLKIAKKKHVLDQISVHNEFDFLSEFKTEQQLLKIFRAQKWLEFLNDQEDSPPECEIISVDFKIKRVRCIEKVGEVSREEIELGGVAIDSNGDESLINARDVAGDNFFKDGRVKHLNPDWVFKKFVNIGADFAETKIFMVTPFMAERDSQGFADFLDEAYKAIKDDLDKIFKELGKVAGGIIGAKIGGTAGAALAGPVGAALGILAGLILGELVSFFIGVFEDDIFPGTDDHIALLAIDNPCFNFNGSSQSPIDTMVFERGGGRYEMDFYWKVDSIQL